MSDIAIARQINPLAGDQEMIREFLTESREHLAAIERQMLLLESNGTSPDLLNAVFRAFHTIKGVAGFFEFAHILAVAHEMETLLDHARSSRLQMSAVVVDVMLESTDVLRREIDAIEATLAGNPSQHMTQDIHLLERIRRVTASGVEACAAQSSRP